MPCVALKFGATTSSALHVEESTSTRKMSESLLEASESVDEDDDGEFSHMDYILDSMDKEKEKIHRARKSRREMPSLDLNVFYGCRPNVLSAIKSVVFKKDEPQPSKMKEDPSPIWCPQPSQQTSILPKKPPTTQTDERKWKYRVLSHYDVPTEPLPPQPEIQLFRLPGRHGRVPGMIFLEESDYYLRNSLRYGSHDGQVNDSYSPFDFAKLAKENMKRETLSVFVQKKEESRRKGRAVQSNVNVQSQKIESVTNRKRGTSPLWSPRPLKTRHRTRRTSRSTADALEDIPRLSPEGETSQVESTSTADDTMPQLLNMDNEEISRDDDHLNRNPEVMRNNDIRQAMVEKILSKYGNISEDLRADFHRELMDSLTQISERLLETSSKTEECSHPVRMKVPGQNGIKEITPRMSLRNDQKTIPCRNPEIEISRNAIDMQQPSTSSSAECAPDEPSNCSRSTFFLKEVPRKKKTSSFFEKWEKDLRDSPPFLLHHSFSACDEEMYPYTLENNFSVTDPSLIVTPISSQ